MANEILIAYVPVLSRRFLDFFERHRGAHLFILGNETISRFDHLRKDLHRVEPSKMMRALTSITVLRDISIYDDLISSIQKSRSQIIMPDEDIMIEIAKTDFPNREVAFEFVGARYDKKKTLEEKTITPDWIVTEDEFSQLLMNDLEKNAQRSPEWWRQIGAALVKDGEILISAINQPTPSPYILDAMGDPRSNFKKGLYVEFSNVLHAEACVISTAARKGISMEGLDLYSTTFPCPPCSRIIAYSGIRRLFFKKGYAMLDGDEILRSQRIQIIQVK